MTRADRQQFSFGYHLISWDLAGEPLDQALAFLADAGFGWFECLDHSTVSTDFERRFLALGEVDPPEIATDTRLYERLALFSHAQIEHGIRMASLYSSSEYINSKTWWREREYLEGLTRILRGFDAPILVLGGGPPETAEREHTAEDYRRFAAALNEIGAYSADLGIAAVYHPHLDCFIERRDQLDRAMELFDTDVVGLCLDPAHFAHQDDDPVDIVRTYAPVIRYVHYKDTRVSPELSGHQRYEAFSELGGGVVDLAGMSDALLDAEYDGIAIIELDMSEKGSEVSARESIAYVRDELGLELSPGVRA